MSWVPKKLSQGSWVNDDVNQFVFFKFNECVTPEISKHFLHQHDASVLIFERVPSSHCDAQYHTLADNSLSNFTPSDLDLREEAEKFHNAAKARRKRRILLDAQRLQKREKKKFYALKNKTPKEMSMRSETNRRHRELYAQRRKSQIVDPCMGNAHSILRFLGSFSLMFCRIVYFFSSHYILMILTVHMIVWNSSRTITFILTLFPFFVLPCPIL